MQMVGIIKDNILKNTVLTWGIIISIVGIDISCIIKIIIKKDMSLISIMMMLASVLLMLMSVRTHDLNYIRVNKIFTVIFLYSFISTILSAFSNIPYMKSESGLIYQLFYLFQLILLWQLAVKINCDFLLKGLFYIYGVMSCLLLIIILIEGSKTGGFFRISFVDYAGNVLVDRDKVGLLGFMTFISSLSYKISKKYEKSLKIIFLTISIIIIILADRRTLVLNTVLVLFLHLKNSKLDLKTSRRKMLFNVVTIMFIILIFTTLLSNNEFIANLIEQSFNSMLNGIKTFLGISVSDQAAGMRYIAISKSIEQMKQETNFLKILFGYGYMSGWVDMPYLQSFYDLGIIGGIIYWIPQLFFIIYSLLKKETESVTQFAQYYLSTRLISNIATGTCYGVFFPIVLYISIKQSIKLKNSNTNKSVEKLKRKK